MATENKTPLIHQLTTWITPGMILIISYLLKTDIDYVKEELKSLTSTNIDVATLKIRVSSLEDRTSFLENKTRNRANKQVVYNIKDTNVAKHEEYICYELPQKK